MNTVILDVSRNTSLRKALDLGRATSVLVISIVHAKQIATLHMQEMNAERARLLAVEYPNAFYFNEEADANQLRKAIALMTSRASTLKMPKLSFTRLINVLDTVFRECSRENEIASERSSELDESTQVSMA